MPRISNAREEILTTALALFWRGSYESVGVDAICRQAGVNKGSFYHFFPSKEDVALNLLEMMHSAACTQLLAPSFSKELPPKERFERFLAMLVRHAEETKAAGDGGRFPGCPIGNLVLELSTQSERLRYKLKDIIESYIGAFEGAIEDAKAVGQLPKSVDARAAAEMIASTWQGGILIAKAYNEPDMCVRIFAQAVACLFGASIPERA